MAMEAEILFDMGGYTRTHGRRSAIAASAMLRGPFRVKNYRCNVFCVLTNKTPVGTYRSPGRYEANFRPRTVNGYHRASSQARSRRRKKTQLIRHEEMPYDLGKHPFHYMVYDTGDLPGQFERALERFGYEDLKATAPRQNSKAAPSVSASVASSKPAHRPWEVRPSRSRQSGQVVLYSGCQFGRPGHRDGAQPDRCR